MLRLVFSRGFVSLALTLSALLFAWPALANEHAGGRSSHADAAPGAEHAADAPGKARGADPQPAEEAQSPSPPDQAPAYGARDDGQRSAEPPAHGARAQDDPASPQAGNQPAPHGSTRIVARSVGPPDFSEPPATIEPQATEQLPETDTAPRPRTRRRAELVASRTGDQRAREILRQPERPMAAPSAARPTTEPSTAAESARSRTDTKSRGSDEASQPLPVRIVPRPIRHIVEVVPAGVWIALALLGAIAVALAAWSWLAALRARRLRGQREDLLQEVGLLQSALLPSVPAGVPVSAAYRPAEGPGAGGDFYEAFALDENRTGVILGEVAGDGREALARTTLIRYTLRAYLEAGLEPREVVKVGSEALGEHLGSGFATVAVAIHDGATSQFTYSSAGHAPPVVVGAEPYEPVTACSAPPLGLGERTGFRQSSFTLTAGAAVCLYTDGIVESRLDGRLLGVGRFERLLADLPPTANGDDVLDRVAEVADEVTDDMAVCLLRAREGAPASGTRIEELEVNEREVGDSLEHFLRACGVPLSEVPGVLREAGEAARREGTATVRVRLNAFRPGVDVVPGNLVRLEERRRAARL